MNGHITPPTPHSVSPSRGQIGAIAAGTYTEITQIIAPSEAAAGDTVTIEVRVKNLFYDWLWLAVTGYDMEELTDIFFSPGYAAVDPDQTYSFTYSFTMPDRRISFAVFSWYSDGIQWIKGDWTLVPIGLAGVPGRIEDVYVWDTKTTQWVAPPLSLSLEDYIAISAMCTNWTDDYLNLMLEAEYISPTGISTITTKTSIEAGVGEVGPKSGIRLSPGGIYVDEAGEWSCHLRLYDGPDRARLFDEWYGSIAQVEAVPEYKGTISKKELEYDESRALIPAYDIPQGQSGLVHIWGRNNTSGAQRMGISWSITDPDGIVVEEYSTWEAWPYTGAGEEHEFIGGRFDMNKAGYWLILVYLMMNPTDPVIVDGYNGYLCTVEAVVPEYKGSIARKELEYDETRGAIPVY